MPYRLNPNNKKEVQIKKGKRWVRLKLHPNNQRALAHLRALKINVEETQ